MDHHAQDALLIVEALIVWTGDPDTNTTARDLRALSIAEGLVQKYEIPIEELTLEEIYNQADTRGRWLEDRHSDEPSAESS